MYSKKISFDFKVLQACHVNTSGPSLALDTNWGLHFAENSLEDNKISLFSYFTRLSFLTGKVSCLNLKTRSSCIVMFSFFMSMNVSYHDLSNAKFVNL